MDIYIKINDIAQGPFSIEQVRQKLKSGQVTLTHSAYIDGRTYWIPLSQVLQPQNTSSITKLPPEPKSIVMQEYQRQCTVCGKVWHSLVSREKEIKFSQVSDSMMGCGSGLQSCGTCGIIGSGTQAQASRNLDANTSELQKLRSCPECGSANFQERIINYANTK